MKKIKTFKCSEIAELDNQVNAFLKDKKLIKIIPTFCPVTLNTNYILYTIVYKDLEETTPIVDTSFLDKLTIRKK